MRNESAQTPSTKPILNGCYVNRKTGMIKVRMLCYSSGQISEILAEDVLGRHHKLALDDWNDLHPVPCCLASPVRRHG